MSQTSSAVTIEHAQASSEFQVDKNGGIVMVLRSKKEEPSEGQVMKRVEENPYDSSSSDDEQPPEEPPQAPAESDHPPSSAGPDIAGSVDLSSTVPMPHISEQ